MEGKLPRHLLTPTAVILSDGEGAELKVSERTPQGSHHISNNCSNRAKQPFQHADYGIFMLYKNHFNFHAQLFYPECMKHFP